MLSKSSHSMGCMQDMWYVARSVCGSYLFSRAYPFTGRHSRRPTGQESEHIKISAIDVVGGGRTGCRSHLHTEERKAYEKMVG